MSAAKLTPAFTAGPWVVVTDINGRRVLEVRRWWPWPGAWQVIAIVGTGSPDNAEDVATANLIAAAPEQHAALIGLLELVELLAANCIDRVDVSNDLRMGDARAVLAKATGSAA